MVGWLNFFSLWHADTPTHTLCTSHFPTRYHTHAQLIELHGPELTVSLLDDMNYAEAVVKEVLRVAPPSGLVMRRTLVDMEVCVGRGAGGNQRAGVQ